MSEVDLTYPLECQIDRLHERIEELELELLETQKDLSFRRDLYALQDQLVDQLRKDLIEARAEAKKWKDNYENQVKINQLLRDRPDLGDRAKSVDALIKQRDMLSEALKEIYNVSVFDWDTMPEGSRRKYREVVLKMADGALSMKKGGSHE
jgi:chromosome segregation ATPase